MRLLLLPLPLLLETLAVEFVIAVVAILVVVVVAKVHTRSCKGVCPYTHMKKTASGWCLEF